MACIIGRVHLGARSDQLLDHFGLAVPSRCMQRRLASVQGVAVRDVREVWLGEIQKSKGVSGCLGWMLKNWTHKNQRDQCKKTCVLFSCLTKSWAWRSQDYASPALGLRYTFGVSKRTISHSHVCLSLIFGIISLNVATQQNLHQHLLASITLYSSLLSQTKTPPIIRKNNSNWLVLIRIRTSSA